MGWGQENLMPRAFHTSQLPAYGYHVMQLLIENENLFLQFPTIFCIEEYCGVVEITFPTKTLFIGLL
jgi:hypothetical protein